MRMVRVLPVAILAAAAAVLLWLARETPEEMLEDVIGGQTPPSLTLLDAGWGSGGGELVSFVHFRIDPNDLARLIRANRFRASEWNERELKGQIVFWKPPEWWDPTRLAGPVALYAGVGPEAQEDAPWNMRLFVDAARAEVFGVREEWWR